MKKIEVEGAPKPVGAYSQAVESNGFVFLSGQIPIEGGEIVRGDFEREVEVVLKNAKKILEGAGSSLDRVVKVTVFLKDMGMFEKFNEIYSRYFTEPYPARVVVEVSRLPKDVDLEIEMIAEK